MCKYAISTEEEYLMNKDIDYRIYLTFLKDSTYNKNLDFRYVYNSNYYLNKNYFLGKLNISKGNLNKLIKNFLKFNLIEKDTVLNENFELKQIYRFNELNNNFVLLSDKEVEKLLTLTSNEIKTYLILRYLLADIKEKNIELGYIAKNIGLSELNTTRTIKKYIDNLKENNLIEYNYYFEFIENKNIKRYKFRIKE
ncbi:hypothetical protein [Peptacetobacter sp. AB800]|uniref:hypothetical protein n=1 Tax=Peptacetobacter sp. AB800 TaxID=3388428 RepID=UPI0039FC403A